MKTLPLLTGFVALGLSASAAFAQAAVPPVAAGPPAPVLGPVAAQYAASALGYDAYTQWAPPYGGTVFGNNAAGLAELIRAQGARNLLDATAATQWQHARRAAIDNHKAYVDAYFSVKQLNNEYRASMRGRRGTYEDFVRYAQAGAPPRLTPAQLDRVSGRISWPVLLRAEVFSPYRAELEKLFAFRAVTGQLSAEEFLRVDQVTNMLIGDLRSRVALLPGQEYVQAKRFVQSLGYEASLPTA